MSYTPAHPRELLNARHYTIGTWTMESVAWPGSHLATIASTAWPLANLALYVPFYVNEAVTVYEAGVGTGATAGGNYDIGIYTTAGVRLVSSGTQGRTASTWEVAPLTDTELQPGWYYAAMSADGTNNYSGNASITAGHCEAMGIIEQGSAFTLPDPATLTTRTTRAFVPAITFAVRSIAL